MIKKIPKAFDIKELILEPDSGNVSEGEAEYGISTKKLVKCNIL